MKYILVKTVFFILVALSLSGFLAPLMAQEVEVFDNLGLYGGGY